jgi:hypothetical protein
MKGLNASFSDSNNDNDEVRKKNIEIMYLRDHIEEVEKEINAFRKITNFMINNLESGKRSEIREYIDKFKFKTNDAIYVKNTLIQIFGYKQQTLLIPEPVDLNNNSIIINNN